MGRLDSGILLTEDADQSGCVETSRITVNTHTSLLNIAEDDEEDEEEEEFLSNSGFLVIDFDEERPSTPPHPLLCRPCLKLNRAPKKHSILDRMTESFLDSFCFSQSNDNNTEVPAKPSSRSSSAETEKTKYRLSVHTDLFDMLEWMTHPSMPEMQFLWNGLFCNSSFLLQQTPKRPQRRTYHQRAMKVRRLREERGDILRSSPISVLQTRSFDISMLRQHEKKIGMESILPVEDIELGYDSDPEEISFLDTSSSLLDAVTTEDTAEKSRTNTNVAAVVQESFHISWKLKLHPTDGGHPTAVRVWLEKGTTIQQEPFMLEPSLMWKRPNENTPHRVRLLNICRIVPFASRSPEYPFARPNRCWTIRTAEDKEIFAFEAPSHQSAHDTMERWKHCIARFASLAVMEDVHAIQREFFYKAPTTRMLVPDYNELDEDY